jgi:hypothetical protein
VHNFCRNLLFVIEKGYLYLYTFNLFALLKYDSRGDQPTVAKAIIQPHLLSQRKMSGEGMFSHDFLPRTSEVGSNPYTTMLPSAYFGQTWEEYLTLEGVFIYTIERNKGAKD